jgi:sugar/nucleoside kinase (ribokinase family)
MVDHVSVLDAFPAADSKQEVLRHWHQIGGPVPVALVQAMRFGHEANFMGKWADDANGNLIEADFAREGLTVHPACRHAEGHSGTASVWVDTQTRSRTIAYARTSAPGFVPGDLDALNLASFDLLHLDGWGGEVALAVAQRVRQLGGRIVLDAGSWKPQMDQLIPLVDLMICSQQFFTSVTGCGEVDQAGPALLALGAPAVILTRGAAGSTFMDGSQTLHAPGVSIEAVDTTGAGDVFSGAMLHALAADRSWPECLRFANAAAAHKCRAYGNRQALPSLADLA